MREQTVSGKRDTYTAWESHCLNNAVIESEETVRVSVRISVDSELSSNIHFSVCTSFLPFCLFRLAHITSWATRPKNN